MRVVVVPLMRFTPLVLAPSGCRRGCDINMVLAASLLPGVPAGRLTDIFDDLGTIIVAGSLPCVPSPRHLDALAGLGTVIIIAGLLSASTGAGLAILIRLRAVGRLSAAWLSSIIFTWRLTPICRPRLLNVATTVVTGRFSLWSRTVARLLVDLSTRFCVAGL